MTDGQVRHALIDVLPLFTPLELARLVEGVAVHCRERMHLDAANYLDRAGSCLRDDHRRLYPTSATTEPPSCA